MLTCNQTERKITLGCGQIWQRLGQDEKQWNIMIIGSLITVHKSWLLSARSSAVSKVPHNYTCYFTMETLKLNGKVMAIFPRNSHPFTLSDLMDLRRES